jgi:hypothetical protein
LQVMRDRKVRSNALFERGQRRPVGAGFQVQSQGSRHSRCTVSLLQDAGDLHRIPFNSAYAAPHSVSSSTSAQPAHVHRQTHSP